MVAIDESARPSRPGYLGFAIEPDGGLDFLAPRGHFSRLDSGALRHVGGLALLHAGEAIELRGFVLRPASGDGAMMELADADGTRWFTVHNPQPHLVPRERHLYLANVDLLLAPELAALLGRPDLVGLYAGTLDLTLPIEAPASFEGLGGCAADFEPPKDLLLTILSNVSQVAREPGVRVAVSLYAELTNLGPGTIPWYRSIEPDGPPQNVGQHPYLGLQMYRMHDGVLRQIGRSDLKHAFFATNTGCGCPSGQVLYPGCDDAYGVSTNENRHYLAPRAEMEASTGTWASLGSHFDGFPVDDFRDHQGESAHDNFEHRLVVPEPELGGSGEFFAESWYVVQDDPDIFNSMGHRKVNPSLSGNVWSFPFGSSLELGSIVDVWIDPESPNADDMVSGLQSPGGEGHVQLGVQVSPAGTEGVLNHFEYALVNHDLDSAVDELFVPLPPGSTPTNIGFEDIDDNPANDWPATVEATGIRWTAPAGNEQPWGSLFNFRFDLDGDASVVGAELGTGGSAGTIDLATLAPGGTADGPVLQIQGDCSSQSKLRAGGMTPNAPVALYRGNSAGTSAIPAGERCPGALLSLGDMELLGGRRADANGRITFGGGFLANTCGQRFQVVDNATCAASNIQVAK